MNISHRKTVSAAMTIALVMLLTSCFLPVMPFDEEKLNFGGISGDITLN